MQKPLQIFFVLAYLSIINSIPSSLREERATFYFANPRESSCSTNDGREGYCLFQGCLVNQLKYDGRCAFGFASCCVAEQSCLKSTNVNNTYFVNPGYPEKTSSLGYCEMTVKRRSSNICQMRLDFIDFELEQPDENGYCQNDVLRIKGSESTVPTLCGANKGQHMYIDVDPIDYEKPVILSIQIKDITLLKRVWNIKITQIECSSLLKAPSGCLQYYVGLNGNVRSFNFGNVTKGTRQLSNTEYSACVRQEAGYCSVTWEANKSDGNATFAVSKRVLTDSNGMLGSSTLSSTVCKGEEDFVLIPDGVDSSGQRSERHCGLGFPTWVKSSFEPFVLRTFTGPTENGDELNTGFSLSYSQNKC